jgi:glycosyltransferase involved in cell wall biosynthesis
VSKKRVHQVLVGAAKNDAITSMALEIQSCLTRFFESEIYCHHPVPPDFPSFVKQISEIEKDTQNDVLIYHLSFGIPEITDFLLGYEGKLVLAYHNVTPFSYYTDLLPEFAEALRYGKNEPAMLLHKTALAIADSTFNAQELEELGYRNVRVIPGGANPYRLQEIGIDVDLLVDLEHHFPNGYLLFVSQVLPHKRVDHALEIVHILRTVHRIDVGLVIAGPIRQPAYKLAADTLRSRLHDTHVLMTDAVTDEQLATLYRGCLCYVGTSEHEGLSVPPLEAMANRAPVVVLGAGAVPETVKNGGIVLPADTGVIEFAEVVAEVIQNETLQSTLRRNGKARLDEGFSENSAEQFVELVMGITV